MIYVRRRKIVVFLFFVALCSTFSFIMHSDSEKVFSHKNTKCIIIDAGHGLPDGGAIGMTGTVESTLNLQIAEKTRKILNKKGYTVIMTREDENSISKEDGGISERKKSDMRKRLEMINTSDADMFVSIHMNKFPSPEYCGAQVIYSGNFKESETLAMLIQKEFHKLPENKSKRAPLKAPQGIYLLKNATIPAVIAECGFLSNFDEEKLLSTEEYQKKLAHAIAKGIDAYYERRRENESVRN